MRAARFLAMPLFIGMLTLFLAGCMQDHRADIPANATLASSGDTHLSYTPARDGTVWVFDKTDNRIDYSGPVMGGNAVTVDPDANVITVNGKTVMNGSVVPGAQHVIYFMPTNPDMPAVSY